MNNNKRPISLDSNKFQNNKINRGKYHRQDSLTELHEAVLQNSETTVLNTIANGVPIDLLDHNGQTALHHASERGYTNLVDTLLKHGADHSIVDVNKKSSLWIASQKGHAKIVLILLTHGAHLDQQANDQTTALYQASYEGHLTCVYYLIRFKASVNLSKNSGASPLLVAARNGHYRIVKHLLKNGADPFQAQADGRSPLHTALLYGRIKCAKLLFSCDPFRWIPQSDIYGWTHLHYLAKKGSIRIARLFFHHLRFDLKPIHFEQIDRFGNTPLHIAIFHEKYSFARYLIDLGFDNDRPNIFGWTPRMIELANKKPLGELNESPSKDYLKRLLYIYPITYTSEEKDMCREVEAYVRSLISEIERLDPLFHSGLICSGSFYEQTRIGLPSEFDYMINLYEIQRLCNFKQEPDDLAGYGRLYPLPTDEAYKKLHCFLEPITGCVSSTKIRTHFYHLLTSSRSSVICQQTVEKFKHLKFEWTSGDKRCGTAIHAQWYGSQYGCITIKIDVVPCLTVYQWPRTAKIACPLRKPEFQLIARSPDTNLSYLWRISTSRTELTDFLSIANEMKDGYLILKILRYINPYKCSVDNESYSADDLLTSYMLKTEFLHEINRNPQQHKWINGGLIHRVTSILKRLHRHLQFGSISSFYIEHYNVIDEHDYARLRSFEIKYIRILLEQVQEKVRAMGQKLKRSQTISVNESINPTFSFRLRSVTTCS